MITQSAHRTSLVDDLKITAIGMWGYTPVHITSILVGSMLAKQRIS